MIHPLQQFSPHRTVRENHPRFTLNPTPQRSGSALPRFGLVTGGGAMGLIRNTMSAIEADKILELTVTDVGAMVLPRTGIELVQRGPVPAQETLFREISGTITNTYLAGWLGGLAVLFFAAYKANPKGMDFNAWIDAKSLGAFGDIAKEVLQKASVSTPKQFQEAFLKTTLGRLKTTMVTPSLPEFRKYFPAGGRLQDIPEKGIHTLSQVVDMFLGRENGKVQPHLHRAFNVEKSVALMQKQKQYVDEIEIALDAFRDRFKAARGYMPLTPQQTQLLTNLERQERATLMATQKRALRMLKTQAIRRQEGTFLKRVFNVVAHNELGDKVFLLDAKGKPMDAIGVRSLDDLLKKTKYFMEEFLNRAIANPTTGEITEETLTPAMKNAIRNRLFAQGGNNWFQRNLLPNLKDGLLPYAYKSKYYMVLLPIAITVGIGCSMVFVNNWLTRRKMGGKNVFPGEEALKKGMGGAH